MGQAADDGGPACFADDGRTVEKESLRELRREAQRLRAAAMEAMFRSEPLTHSAEVDALGGAPSSRRGARPVPARVRNRPRPGRRHGP
ncbi:hypothetical protein [Streptomyces sp. NPDC048385]|uniref:hypothetical protein n=1 Tax=unclassified Streptomyces TaxID=2593676 RepID=UPI00343FBD2B